MSMVSFLKKNEDANYYLKNYKLFFTYERGQYDPHTNTIHQKTILEILYSHLNINEDEKGIFILLNGMLVYSKKDGKIDYKKYFMHGSNIESFQDFKDLFDDFSSIYQFSVYKNAQGDLRFAITLDSYREIPTFLFDLHVVDTKTLSDENKMLQRINTINENRKNYKFTLFTKKIMKCALFYNKNAEHWNPKNIQYSLNYRSVKLSGNHISKMEYARLKYYVMIKDNELYGHLKKYPYISTRVLNLCIESGFKITLVQANLLNHLLGRKIYFTNGHGGLYYNIGENGIGWSHDRHWVKKQLKPFIESGLIHFHNEVAPRDNRYRIWYFYDGKDKHLEADDLRRHGYENWQGKFKGDVL